MKRSKTTDTKHNKKQKLSTMSEECKIIDTIDIQTPRIIIQTPCGKFLIGIEGNSIFSYCLETKQKVRIAGSFDKFGHQDGTRDESRFNNPRVLTLSKDLKTLFISDFENCVIRAICVETGMTTTFAGQYDVRTCIDGPKEKACFMYPSVLKFSPDGNTLYVADFYNLRKICIATGQVDTIGRFKNCNYDFTFSPDGKHVFICHWAHVLKYNLETGKSEIIFKDKGSDDFVSCELSKDGQLLFIASYENKFIQVVNLVTNKVIDKIFVCIEPTKLTVSTNSKQLYVCNGKRDKVQVLDISNYCTNFKTFIQSQLSKHSFLPRQVIRFN
jgi:DNA-binding beta-propeller fold protein YncE